MSAGTVKRNTRTVGGIRKIIDSCTPTLQKARLFGAAATSLASKAGAHYRWRVRSSAHCRASRLRQAVFCKLPRRHSSSERTAGVAARVRVNSPRGCVRVAARCKNR